MLELLLGDNQFGTPTIAEQVVVVGECIRRYFGITVAHAQTRCSSSRDPERGRYGLSWVKGWHLRRVQATWLRFCPKAHLFPGDSNLGLVIPNAILPFISGSVTM